MARSGRTSKRRHHSEKLRNILKQARAGEAGADMVARDAIMVAGYSPERAEKSIASKPISDAVRWNVAQVQEKQAARRAKAAERKAERVPAGAHRKANDGIHDMIHNKYFTSIPLESLFLIVEKAGFRFDPDERATMFVAGRSGRDTWQLFGPTGKPENHMLVVQWHKMENSGRYEVVAYVS